MFQSLCILGRQPAIGLAELESLYSANKLLPVGSSAALLDIEPAKVAFAYLGGTIKFCKVLTELDTTNWVEVVKFLEQAVPEHAAKLPEGKMKLGLSVYGLDVTASVVSASALKLKKHLVNRGKSVRVVPNKELALNSAQVLSNKLTGALGWELIIVKNGSKTILAQSIAVQDVNAYAKRDQQRPKRDSKVGMLPPKLAQIIINLASANSVPPVCHPDKQNNQTILDPFCGTGVILQEAALMGFDVYGTDLEKRMVEYAKVNLDWLGEKLSHPPFTYDLDEADATSYKWPHQFEFLACEAYLGRPFTSSPSTEILKQTIAEVNTITRKFLLNLAGQAKPGFRVCLAVPAWHVNSKVHHLPLLDQLTDMGYNRVSFVHARDEDLIYHREGQIVGRELVTLIRK